MLIARFLFLFIIVSLLGFNNVSHSQNPDKTKGDDSNKGKKKKGDEKTNGKIRIVVVEGVGDSSENAVKDAQRNAVNQVVGVLIDAKVMVKNDKLIEDKILTFSNGFVKTSKVISQNKSGKLFKVKIEAVVEVTGIENILRKEKLMTTGLVDGEGLLGESQRKEEVIKNGAKMLREKMKDFPMNVLDIQLNEKATKILKNESGTSTVQYEISVKPDLEKYRIFSKQLVQILDKIAISKSEGILEFKLAKVTDLISKKEEEIYSFAQGNGLSSLVYSLINKKRWDYGDFRNWEKDVDALPTYQLAIATNRTSTGNSISYNVYTLDKFFFDEKPLGKKLVSGVLTEDSRGNKVSLSFGTFVVDTNLKIKLRDIRGDEIISKKISSLKTAELNSKDFGRLEVWKGPNLLYSKGKIVFFDSVFFNLFDFRSHTTSLLLTPTIEIPNEDLKKVKKVEVTIE